LPLNFRGNFVDYFLAIDIGASSGRHILGHFKDGKIRLEEIYRFENSIKIKDNKLCWDLKAIFDNILNGLKKCKELNKIPKSLGIDTWGVDFILLDSENKIIGDSVSYRDSRTQGMDTEVQKYISDSELYAKTGIQKQIFNTIYQLMAIKTQNPEHINKAESFLMIPDYLNFLLTGVKTNEYTNATTTGLVNAKSKDWDRGIINCLGFPKKLFVGLSMPKTIVGELKEDIKNKVGFNCQVILPATHDTGSAFLAVPARDENAVFISSGTWSLIGVENSVPITNEESRRLNFTNEGGFDYRFRYLKNIMGLWIIQSIRKDLGKKYSFAELEEMAEKSSFDSIIDVNDQRFLSPHNMIDAVKSYLTDTRKPTPANLGELMQCVYKSLATSYNDSIQSLKKITKRDFTSINIVGGGSRDKYLNKLTAKITGLPVFAGPGEGTALGNIIVQMMAFGVMPDLKTARESIVRSFDITKYDPN